MRIALALLLVLLAIGCGDGSKSDRIEGVQSFSVSGGHLTKGQYPHTYPQSPPVGGIHSGAWLACGVYRQQPPNENAVHSLEHGAVWVTYLPGFKDVAALEQLSQVNREYVLVTPYAGQTSPVVVTAWGLQLDLQSADDPRLLRFIRRYAGGGQGGEPGATCATGGLTPAQAQQYDNTLR